VLLLSHIADAAGRELRSYPQWGQLALAVLALPPVLVGLALLPPALATLVLLALMLTAGATALRTVSSQGRRGER
jgi:hypothetical protein